MVAKRVNSLFGTHTGTRASKEGFANVRTAIREALKNEGKYTVSCPHCGRTWKMRTKTKFIRAVFRDGGSAWRCPCGSTGDVTITEKE